MTPARYGRWLLVAGAVAIVATLVAAVLIMGTPGAQREARLDARRVGDLALIGNAIDAFGEGRALPKTLAELDQDTRMRLTLVDPVDGEAYGYSAGADGRYRLCARFAADSRDAIRRGEAWHDRSWDHPAGEHCFDREKTRDRRGHGERNGG